MRSLIDKKEVWLQTIKDKKGKYGRYLGEIWIQDAQSQWINVNDLIVEKGFAEYKEY